MPDLPNPEHPVMMDEELVERVARALATKHYVERLKTAATDPWITKNVDGNWQIFTADALTAIEASGLEQLHNRVERLTLALWLYREFVIRNATQWQPGAGHHHPIWAMIAELVNEEGGIISGPFYEFIQPEMTRRSQH